MKVVFAGTPEFAAVVLRFGDVDRDDLLVHVHLARGQANAGRVIHGVGHVGHQLAQALGAEFGHGRGNLVQAWVGIAKDVE